MNRIKELRKKAGMTQTQLGRVVHVSQGTISAWENGEVEIDNEALKALAEFFGVSIDYLLAFDVEKAQKAEPEVTRSSGLTDEDLAKIASIVNPNAEAPRTVEARIVSFGMDKLPAETRELILGMIRGMFANKPEAEYFTEKKGEAD